MAPLEPATNGDVALGNPTLHVVIEAFDVGWDALDGHGVTAPAWTSGFINLTQRLVIRR